MGSRSVLKGKGTSTPFPSEREGAEYVPVGLSTTRCSPRAATVRWKELRGLYHPSSCCLLRDLTNIFPGQAVVQWSIRELPSLWNHHDPCNAGVEATASLASISFPPRGKIAPLWQAEGWEPASVNTHTLWSPMPSGRNWTR